MSDNIEDAKRLGLTDEELGIAQPDLAEVCPDDITVAQQNLSRNDKLPQRNSYPIPEGSPQHLIPMFRCLAHEKVMRLKQVYDTFEKKDIPFVEFCVEYELCTNPMLMQQDMENMMATRHNKSIIDNATRKR